MAEGTTLAFGQALAGPDHALTGPGTLRLAGGTIAAVHPGGAPGPLLAMPALCNAHDHGRGMRTLAFGAADDTLEFWLTRLGLEPLVDPYLRAVVAFGRMAESGIACLNHCHNPQIPGGLAEEAAAVRRAAHDVGVRVAFAAPLAGRNPVVLGDPDGLYRRLPGEAADKARARAAAVRPWKDQLADLEGLFELSDDLFHVQYGPVAPHWVEDAALAAIAERSAETGRRVHMHLLESHQQREWADDAYPDGIVRHLDALGLLSPRLTVAHGVWLRRDEAELLAERGVHVSVNTSSNLRLRSGIAPLADFVAAGLKFGLGLDGMAFDDDEDALREMRLLWHLQRGFGLTDVMTRERLLRAVLTDSRSAILGGTAPGLTAGAPADVLLLDTARMTEDTVPGLADLTDLLLTRASRADVAELWVAGRQVVRGGRCTGVDLAAAEAELTAGARAAATTADPAMLDAVTAAYRDYYRCGCHLHHAEAVP